MEARTHLPTSHPFAPAFPTALCGQPCREFLAGRTSAPFTARGRRPWAHSVFVQCSVNTQGDSVLGIIQNKRSQGPQLGQQYSRSGPCAGRQHWGDEAQSWGPHLKRGVEKNSWKRTGFKLFWQPVSYVSKRQLRTFLSLSFLSPTRDKRALKRLRRKTTADFSPLNVSHRKKKQKTKNRRQFKSDMYGTEGPLGGH